MKRLAGVRRLPGGGKRQDEAVPQHVLAGLRCGAVHAAASSGLAVTFDSTGNTVIATSS